MTRYFINPENANGVKPYDRPEKGANNFYELITNPATKINLFDGDVIELYNPCPEGVCVVDDSSHDIEITKAVSIKTYLNDNQIFLKLKNDGAGMILTRGSSGASIFGLKFIKDSFDDGYLLYVDSVYSINIRKCGFYFDALTNDGISIYLKNSKYVLINECEIKVPTISIGSGIRAESCDRIKVYSNSIDFDSNNGGYGINADSTGAVDNNGIYIHATVFYGMNFSSKGISINGNLNTAILHSNIFRIYGDSTGIISNTNDGYGFDMSFVNNTFIFEDNSENYGIVKPDTGANSTEMYEIANNIFYYEPVGGTFTSGYCIDAQLQNTQEHVVNHNGFYKIAGDVRFFWQGNPSTVSAMGNKNLDGVDPQLKYYITNDEFHPLSAADSYQLSGSSKYFGFGVDGESIGNDGNNSLEFYNITNTNTHENGVYVPIIDTFVGEFIQVSFFQGVFNLINSVLGDSLEKINLSFGLEHELGDIYECQYGWSDLKVKSYPFTPSNKFYNQILNYVIANKIDFAPFNDILCPPNPGYNFSAYEGYETGLFAESRADYPIECVSNIIRDYWYEYNGGVIKNKISSKTVEKIPNSQNKENYISLAYINNYTVDVELENIRILNSDGSVSTTWEIDSQTSSPVVSASGEYYITCVCVAPHVDIETIAKSKLVADISLPNRIQLETFLVCNVLPDK